ncbi:MAG: DUF2461 domain-containing protein, partial [Muribaculaceae bacterium]|nr:DUF2461 domain-containing protein [Muribaculaceae bacterium]
MGRYIKDLYEFLREVQVNNNREWFAANKERYDELRHLWLADLDRLISDMTKWEPGMSGQNAKTSAYRFYRDTRFSKDKSPYKIFFSALLSPMGRKTTKAAWYLHMGPQPNAYSGSGVYGGYWCAETPILKKLRHAIADNIEEWEEIVNAPEMQKYYPGWCGDTLKSMPQGWPKDHPLAEVLKLKEIGKYTPITETE